MSKVSPEKTGLASDAPLTGLAEVIVPVIEAPAATAG